VAKFNLLLLDANVIIYLFELELWGQILERCNVYLCPTVIDEADFWYDQNGERHEIDMSEYEGRYSEFKVPPSRIAAFHTLGWICRKASAIKEKMLIAISLFKERRTASISAAVTGKIELRGWEGSGD
jgi:hypothetical protein